MGDYAVPGSVDIREAGPHLLIDNDGTSGTGRRPGSDQQLRVGAHPDGDEHEVRRAGKCMVVAFGPFDQQSPGRPEGARATLRTVVEVETCTP